MKRIALPLSGGIIALAACQTDKLNAPPEHNTSPVAAASSNDVTDLALLAASIDDAINRLAPALEDPLIAKKVVTQLVRLSAALTANAGDARNAIADVRRVLTGTESSPNAAAIELALARAEMLLR